MTDRRNDAARSDEVRGREHWVARRGSDGGIVIERDGALWARAVPTREGWSLEGLAVLEGGSLTRSMRGGFTFRQSDRESGVAATTPLVGVDASIGLRTVLLHDGRMFRIALCGPRDARYELTDWEVPGAYLTANPGSGCWRLVAEPSSAGLQEMEVLTLLLAVEVLDADDALSTVTS